MSASKEVDVAYRRVIGISATLFLSYLTVAMSLPVIPVYAVHQLGLNNALGGLAVGIAFLSTILRAVMQAVSRTGWAASPVC
jgi:hypothetical protein